MSWNRMRALPVLMLCVVCAAPVAAGAAETPDLRHGLWKLKKTINQRPYESRQCMQPFDELIRRQNELRDSGCVYEVAQPAVGQWRVTTRCRKQNAEGRRWESDTESMMTVVSDTAYRLEVRGTTNTVPSQETIEGFWTGPCQDTAR